MKKAASLLIILFTLSLYGCNSTDSTLHSPDTNPNAALIEEAAAMVTVSKASSDYVDKNFDVVISELRAEGFENTEAQAIDDLTSKSDISDGSVISVSIDSLTEYEAGHAFPINAKVIVQYHRIPRIQIPISAMEAQEMTSTEVAQELFEAGFINVTTEEHHDLDPDTSNVKCQTHITVNGQDLTNDDTELPFDAEIIAAGHYPFRKYSVCVTLDFEKNWIFSKYGLVFTAGNENPIELEHGQSGTFDFRLPEGIHTFRFVSTDKSEISSEVTLNVSCDINASYHIQCYSDSVELTEQELTYQDALGENEIRAEYSSGYYLRKLYLDCMQTLQDQGFTNLKANPINDTIWGPTQAGQVVSVSIGGNNGFQYGDRCPKNAEVVVSYHVPKVSFPEESMTVTEGDSFTLPCTISDGNSLSDIAIQVQDPSLIESSGTDTYTAMKPGSTVIAAYYQDLCLAKCDVTVEKLIIPISAVSLPRDEITVAVGSTFPIEYSIEPHNANYTELSIALSNSLLEQKEDGTFYSLGEGDTQITFSQDERELAVCHIHAVVVPIEAVTFLEKSIEIGVGRTAELDFSLLPDHATNYGLEVSVANPQIAAVSLSESSRQMLEITGASPGSTTVTLSSSDSVSAVVEVTVKEVILESLAIETETRTPLIGSSGILTAKFTPADTTLQKITWKSSAPNVIRIASDGTYQALSVGNAIITASHPSGVSQTIELKVLPVEVTKIALYSNWDDSTPFFRNNTMTITADIYPENATNKAITWSSSDESIATVSSKGLVKAVSDGTAVITATSANGVAGSYPIIVEISPQKFRISGTIRMLSNDSVGNHWSSGFEFNGEEIRSGSTVSILPGDSFTVCGWAEDADSNPDYGYHFESLTLTKEMCQSGFTIEDDFDVRENGGRYSGNVAVWHMKMTFTPIN